MTTKASAFYIFVSCSLTLPSHTSSTWLVCGVFVCIYLLRENSSTPCTLHVTNILCNKTLELSQQSECDATGFSWLCQTPLWQQIGFMGLSQPTSALWLEHVSTSRPIFQPLWLPKLWKQKLRLWGIWTITSAKRLTHYHQAVYVPVIIMCHHK